MGLAGTVMLWSNLFGNFLRFPVSSDLTWKDFVEKIRIMYIISCYVILIGENFILFDGFLILSLENDWNHKKIQRKYQILTKQQT